MKVVPIVFCFDSNWLLAAGVCITSLLENAKQDTFYDIFILYGENSKEIITKSNLSELAAKYSQCKITFRSVGKAFDKAFEIRGITTSTYYRLLIPEIIPEYGKIMYHDVDVIFRADLSDIYFETDMSGCYVAGVSSPGSLNPEVRKQREAMGLTWNEYILAGDIIFNSELIRKDKIVEKFKKEVLGSTYEHQDMDIINIVCKGKIKRLPPAFCATLEIFRLATFKVAQKLFTQEELQNALQYGIIHYNGPKPWETWCLNYDIWWEYYRKSIFYDDKYYFEYYADKYHELEKIKASKLLKLFIKRVMKKIKQSK